ncbi:major royal jelly protein-like 7 isoform X1 [Nasonia vitripennis]|uniref:Bee-milk protein n=1 Tax=Nasonia vitripennis TaxID=7425 RepID=A0A7M7QCY3_NASVI|nr:major royal jelly protein-like 7 precursor [Nasonia vitripennis]XP_031784171.1 major royal jelly protein-like 7 isoform X1 [Nasonia vitripennis]XP_032457853.1 major royal jelly protein-like 7 isoform X1 [Nasonia vitripennis]
MRSLLCAFILLASSMLVSAGYMDTLFEWKYVDYLWESEARRQEAINSGAYDFSRILPMDVDKSKDGRIFVSFLGMDGVPATLATVSNQKGPSGPLVKPYPDWSWFKKGDCNSITNVYRIAIDECNRLWILDTGFLEGQAINCEAQLLAFDLNTDRLIQRIKIPNNIARSNDGQTLLATPIVETEGPYCDNTTVYMADTMGEGLVIWNGVRLFRLESPLFKHDESAKNIVVGNSSLDLAGGIVGMDLSPRIFPGESRFLYFHALASYDIYAAETNVLRRSTYGESVKFLGARDILSSQAVGQAFSSEGTLFLGMTREIAIACWNRYRELKRSNIEIVAQDSERLQYANGVKVIPPTPYQREEELLVLTNRFVTFQLGQLDANDVNFRVLKSPVKRLIAGTKCEIPRNTLTALGAINKQDESFLIVQN